MTDFSGEPERWRNVSRPDPPVRSSKTTGAPSTKPPAVMGRERASLIGANTPAVLEPPDGGVDGLCGAWAAATAIPAAIAAATRNPDGTRFTGTGVGAACRAGRTGSDTFRRGLKTPPYS